MSDWVSCSRNSLLMMMRLFLASLLFRVNLPKLLDEGVLLYRGVGLREPVQQIATTLGWLRRDGDTVGTARQSSSRQGTCNYRGWGWWCERPIASYVVEERCCGADLADRLKRRASAGGPGCPSSLVREQPSAAYLLDQRHVVKFGMGRREVLSGVADCC